MFADWTCAYDSGDRPYAPGIAIDQRRPLHIVAGDAVTIRIALVTPTGAPVVLGDGEHLVWMAKSLGEPSRKLLSKQSTVTAPGSGRYQIALATAETRLLAPGRAVHDLFAIRGSARVVVIPLSDLVIARSSLGGP